MHAERQLLNNSNLGHRFRSRASWLIIINPMEIHINLELGSK